MPPGIAVEHPAQFDLADRTEVIAPSRPGNGAAVVVVHGALGVTSEVLDFARVLTDRGFTAVVPRYFERPLPHPAHAAPFLMRDGTFWQRTLSRVLREAASPPLNRTAVVGFCIGGHLALRLRGLVPVVVEYHAPYLTGIGNPGSPARHVQIHHGEADGVVAIGNVEQIAAQLHDEGVAPEIHRYAGAGHRFHGSEAWNISVERTVAFLVERLRLQ